MYQVEDEPIETIHLYVVREGDRRPSLIPVIISVFALSILIAIGILIPDKQPEQRASIRVPAVLSFTKTFSATVTVVPTGIKTYPATLAHGVLTITNGSILSEELPKGMILTGNDGVEVATDTIFVPAGSAAGFGLASVTAHALQDGKSGNIQPLDINQVQGTSLFMRNLSAFSGGRDAYSITFATQQDHQKATRQARAILTEESAGLHYPCQETYSDTASSLRMTWRCQFVTYSVPSYMHVTSVQLQGNELIVVVLFVAHPKRIWVK